MHKILTWAMLFLATFAHANNILLIGDSHSVGPYGQRLFSLLRNDGYNLALYAHSSSSAIHWTSTKTSKLSGGVLHQMFLDGELYTHPYPTHWRERVSTISFIPLLENMIHHPQWRVNNKTLSPNLVVIGLGANDYFSLTDSVGEYKNEVFKVRQKAILKLLENIPKCVWVLPPKMQDNDEKRFEKLYVFLKDSIQNRCEIVLSNEFQVEGCDGIHFSCPAEVDKAHRWAKKVYLKIKELL